MLISNAKAHYHINVALELPVYKSKSHDSFFHMNFHPKAGKINGYHDEKIEFFMANVLLVFKNVQQATMTFQTT